MKNNINTQNNLSCSKCGVLFSGGEWKYDVEGKKYHEKCTPRFLPTILEEEGKLFDEKYPIGTFGYSDTEDRNSLKSFLFASHKRVLGAAYDMAIDATDEISKQYDRALKENNHEEANGYAHSIAIVNVFIKKIESYLQEGTTDTNV